MVQNQTAAPVPPAGAAKARLDWRHERMRLKIGRNHYTLRTLSLMDAMEIEKHLDPLVRALEGGSQPYTFAVHIIAVAKTICPMILDELEDVKALGRTEIMAILDFYKQQDWDRVRLVRELKTDMDDEDEEAPEGQNERTVFYAVAAACAERARMDVMKFLDQRLEFCMDVILALHQDYAKAKTAGKMPHGSFVQAMTAMMGGAKQYTRDTAPAWMKDLAEIADKENEPQG
jgi:hypothetical protein